MHGHVVRLRTYYVNVTYTQHRTARVQLPLRQAQGEKEAHHAPVICSQHSALALERARTDASFMLCARLICETRARGARLSQVSLCSPLWLCSAKEEETVRYCGWIMHHTGCHRQDY